LNAAKRKDAAVAYVEKISAVTGKPPPKPESYPTTVTFLDFNGVKSVTVNSEHEYSAVVFWYWFCTPSF
jgi:hypothetical protein